MTTVRAIMLPLTLKVLFSEMDLAEIYVVFRVPESGSTTMLLVAMITECVKENYRLRRIFISHFLYKGVAEILLDCVVYKSERPPPPPKKKHSRCIVTSNTLSTIPSNSRQLITHSPIFIALV
jgi:hypothetical protein